MQTKLLLVLMLTGLISCKEMMEGEHQRHINELIYYKEKLTNLQETLQQKDTANVNSMITEARLKLLSAEQSLPKTVSPSTAKLFMAYKKDYTTLVNDTWIYSSLLNQVKKALQQNQNLLTDLQNNRLEARTEAEMVERECNVARSLQLSYTDLSQSKQKAIHDIKQAKEKIDSAIAAITKLKVE